MTSPLSIKLRLVRCPRCFQVLQELPNVPVYACGGCKTVLQAKKCKKDTKDTGLHKHETHTVQKNEREHVSEDKEARSLSKEEPISSTELPLEKNSGRGQNEVLSPAAMLETEVDQDVCSDEVASSTALHQLEIESSSPATGDHSEGNENGKCLEQDDGRNKNEYAYCKGKQPRNVTFSEEVASSTELNHLMSEEPSLAVGAHIEGGENGKCLEQDNCCNGKQSGGENFTEEAASSNEPHRLEIDLSSPVAGAHSEGDENGKCMEQDNCNGRQSGGENFTEEVASSKELHLFEIEEPSPVAGAPSEIHEIRNCSEEDNERFQNEHGYLDGKQYGGENFTEKVASSNKLNDLGIEESPLVARAHSEVDEIRNCLEQDNASNRISSPRVAGAPSEIHESRTCSEEDNQRYQHEHGSCNENQSVGENFTKEDPSSIETNHLKSKDSSPVAGAHSNVHEIKSCLEEDKKRYQNENGSCNGNQSRGENLTDKVASSTALNHLESEESPPVAGAHSEVHDVTTCFEKNNGRKQSEFEDHERECPGNTKFSDEVPSSTELTGPEIEESFPEVDENIKSSIFGSSRVENLLAARPKDSIITAQGPLGESILTEPCTSLHCDQLEQPQKRSLAGFDRVNSIDTSGNIILANSGSEVSITLRDMHKSATTRSNHAYDGSVSSYNGTDDQVPDQYRRLWKRKWKAAESSSTKAIPRRNEVTNTIIEKKQYHMRGGKWHQDEFLGPTSHGHTARSRMRFESGECRSRVPFYSRVGYEKGGPSNYERKQFRSPNKPKNPGEGNLELLKMVFELQDQLNRTRMSKGNGNGRFPGTDKHIPSYYDRVAPEVEICPNLIHTTCPRRCNQGKIRPHQSRTSRIPFSSQVDHFCVHCIPQDWHSSAPLPPYIFYNESQYTAHPCQRHYNLHRSSPSSPQHHTSSEFSSQSCGENSGDRWHKDREVKKYPRERNYLKKHVRPVAIGAPFLVCYHCSEVLKLPEDFLLFRRKCQKLKCSACSVILKFSLQNRTHVVPYTDYTPDATAPPPSEVTIMDRPCVKVLKGSLSPLRF
ncbi:Protein ENHANCED DISEASE RESISTANCE like [Actinidia chinensis var. chinensis]|uniref:Protein ENHANCED DISEASE RESISTANCE like n=1 Tax=Actinidia chinensis var. chinensis TaxID=1590841 RepID=A0A2R6RR39_ACTCC|nr:Protein ENHANCED DISEASE RESISTANCE like [Actinidia chinensis var. chinensis]